jgi:hypothetical protein
MIGVDYIRRFMLSTKEAQKMDIADPDNHNPDATVAPEPEEKGGSIMDLTVTSVAQLMGAIGAFIALVRELMSVAQSSFGSGTGDTKREVVLSGIEHVIGNDTIWQDVKGLFTKLVTVLAFFKPKTTQP